MGKKIWGLQSKGSALYDFLSTLFLPRTLQRTPKDITKFTPYYYQYVR
jgi:hypothetical protein